MSTDIFNNLKSYDSEEPRLDIGYYSVTPDSIYISAILDGKEIDISSECMRLSSSEISILGYLVRGACSTDDSLSGMFRYVLYNELKKYV